MTMRIALESKQAAPACAAVRFLAVDKEKPDARHIDPDNWQVDRFDIVQGGWTRQGAPMLQSIRIADPNSNILYLQFDLASGPIRITCLAPDVEEAHRVTYFRDLKGEPYRIRVEGLPFNEGIIPYCFLDADNMPSGISQKLSLSEGISEDSSLSFELVDLDGSISRYFDVGHDAPLTSLTREINADQPTLDVVDSSAFPGNGPLWIDRECMWSLNIGNTFYTHRGMFGTEAAIHEQGATVYGSMPNAVGRLVWLEKETGEKIYSGVIESFRPGNNLATYEITLVDPKMMLDVPVGSFLATANIGKEFVITEGDNRFHIVHRNIGTNIVTEAEVELAPGRYDITPGQSYGGDASPLFCSLSWELYRKIKSALISIDDAKPVKVWINEKGCLSIMMRFGGSLEFIRNENADLLSRLGFKENIDFSDVKDMASFILSGNLSMATRVAENPLGGAGSGSSVIPVDQMAQESGIIKPLGNSRIVRIDDEVLMYKKFVVGSEASSSLAESIDGESTQFALNEVLGEFENGDFIKIDDEEIWLGIYDSERRHCQYCQRGINGTTASSHQIGASVKRMAFSRLEGCRRGLYGTKAVNHECFSEIAEVLVSDTYSGSSAYPRNPMAFLRTMLRSPLGHPSSLNLHRDIVDSSGIDEADDLAILPLGRSFAAIIDAGTTYREVLTNICRALGYFGFVDANGRISVGSLKPVLAHQGGDHRIENDELIVEEDLGIHWSENRRVQSVVIQMDHRPDSEEYSTRMVMNNNRQKSDIWKGQDNSVRIDADYFHGAYSTVRSGGTYNTWAIELALIIFERFGRFLDMPRITVASKKVPGIQIGQTVSLFAEALPSGDGKRGIDDKIYHVVEVCNSLEKETVTLGLLGGVGETVGFNLSAYVLDYDDTGSIELTISREDFWPHDLVPNDIIRSGDSIAFNRFTSSRIIRAVAVVEGEVPEEWIDDAATIELVAPPSEGFIPAEGDVITAGEWDESFAENSTLKKLAYICDENGSLGVSNKHGNEYGVGL